MRVSLALASLFLSGFAALLFEVCWIRRCSLVFGSTTVALSTVLGIFFLGLALGSEGFGRVSRSVRRPLRVLAVAEEMPTLKLLRRHLGPVDEILTSIPDSAWRAASHAQREHNLADLTCAVLLRQIEGQQTAGHFDAVLALAREAQRANPLNHQAHRVAGGALLSLGRKAEARDEFQAALRLRADDPLALRGLPT